LFEQRGEASLVFFFFFPICVSYLCFFYVILWSLGHVSVSKGLYFLVVVVLCGHWKRSPFEQVGGDVFLLFCSVVYSDLRVIVIIII